MCRDNEANKGDYMMGHADYDTSRFEAIMDDHVAKIKATCAKIMDDINKLVKHRHSSSSSRRRQDRKSVV